MNAPANLVALILDDDELWLRSLSRLLKQHGITSVRCTTAEEAFAAMERQDVHICLIDFVLGRGWDGAQFARELRDKLGDGSPPLVLLSGTLDQVEIEDRRPFDAAYDKGLTPLELVGELRNALLDEGRRPNSHWRIRPMRVTRKRRQTPTK